MDIQPTMTLHTLTTADGSAVYKSPSDSLTIISGVNYPLEVPYRSKEIPEDTYIEVNMRPHNAVAGVKERHVEAIVRRVLTSVVWGRDTPRCMLQVTLQVLEMEPDEALPGGVRDTGIGNLEILAGAINGAVAGCLDAGVSMRGLVGVCLVSVSGGGEDGKRGRKVVVWPGLKVRKEARSVHCFGFGSGGECMVWESEGRFSIEEWAEAERIARRSVLGADKGEERDVDMGESQSEREDEQVRAAPQSLFGVMRRAVETRVARDSRWKEKQ